MQLPQDDRNFLTERGYDWVLHTDNEPEAFLVIKNFNVGSGGFVPPLTDLMIRIPTGYNMAQLDMWYCSPPIRLSETGQFVAASEVVEQHVGRQWQRFSRHLPTGAWRAGIDNLRTFMPFILKELQGHKVKS